MPIWIAVLLGVVQGLTEFLPVSSSGHLALLQNIFNFNEHIQNSIAFDIILHLGTLVAVCIAFRHDIAVLLKAFVGFCGDGFRVKKMPSRRMIVMLVIATCPLVVGALIDDKIEAMFHSTLFIGCALLITAVLLFTADRIGGGKKTEKDAGYGNALEVGLMQLIATFPGISRSGSTICAGLFCKFDRDFAVRFAFLLSIPAVLGASVLKLPALLSEGLDTALILPYIVGFLAAAISGYFAICLVRTLMKKNSFKVFAIYCACAGIGAIIYSLV